MARELMKRFIISYQENANENQKIALHTQFKMKIHGVKRWP